MTSVVSPKGFRGILKSDVFCWDELPELLAAEELFSRGSEGPALPSGPISARDDDDDDDDDEWYEEDDWDDDDDDDDDWDDDDDDDWDDDDDEDEDD